MSFKVSKELRWETSCEKMLAYPTDNATVAGDGDISYSS